MSKYSIPMLLIVDGANTDSKKKLLKDLSEKLEGEVLYLDEPVFDRAYKHNELRVCFDQFGFINLSMYRELTETLGLPKSVMSKRRLESTRKVDKNKWIIINRNPCNALDYNVLGEDEHPIYNGLDQKDTEELEVYNYTYRPCYLCVTEHKLKELKVTDEEVKMLGMTSIIENLVVGLNKEHYLIPNSIMLLASQQLFIGRVDNKNEVVFGVFG